MVSSPNHFFPGRLEQAVNHYFVHILSLVTDNNNRYGARIELTTPGSAVRHASVARHVTHCATLPGKGFTLILCSTIEFLLPKLYFMQKKCCFKSCWVAFFIFIQILIEIM